MTQKAKRGANKCSQPNSLGSSAEATARRNFVVIEKCEEGRRYRQIAEVLLRPETNAAGCIEAWQADTHDINDLAEELAQQTSVVNAGDLSRAEAMLISQAHTLENIFAHLMRRSAGTMPMDKWEAYMRMALKAQNQSRMTLATLGELKNPRSVAFVRQANIAHGPQQVNNGAPDTSRTGQNDLPQNELLEVANGERLDIGTTHPSSAIDSRVEALVEVDGSAHCDRQEAQPKQRMEGRLSADGAPALKRASVATPLHRPVQSVSSAGAAA